VAERKKIVKGLKGSDGETHIQVECEVLLGASPCKSCNRFLNNYKAEFGLKQHLIFGAELAYVRSDFSSANIKMQSKSNQTI